MFGINFNQFITALVILGISIFAAFLLFLLLKKNVSRLVSETGTTLDNEILKAIEKPVLLAVVLFGLYLATGRLTLSEQISSIISVIIHSFLAALIVYTANALLQRILKWYCDEIACHTKTSLDDRIIPALRKVIYMVAGFMGIVWILDIIGVDLPWLRNWLIQHGARMALIIILSMALMFVLGRLIPTAVKPAVLRKAKEQPEEEIKKKVDTLSGVFVNASQVIIIFMAVFMLLSEIGLNIAPLLAGAGVAGLAIGFGAQSLIKDILNGLFIIMENQYSIGDVVKIADISGLVEDISLRRTVLRDLDGIVHSVPNGEIRVSSNFTREWSRVNLNISVGYGEDLDRVISVINKVGNELSKDPAWAPLILKPPQALRVDNLGDSGIEIKILGDTKPIEQWNVMGELRKRLKRAFDEEGIEIPWPHTKVYFGNSPPTVNP